MRLTPSQTPNAEQKLAKIYRQLDDNDQSSLLDFADFLQQRSQKNQHERKIVEPILEKPTDKESVIAALKRLSRSYPMLKKSSLFDHASELMMQHTLQGRSTKAVIKDLEAHFSRIYVEYRADLTDKTP